MSEFSQFPDDIFLVISDYLTDPNDIYSLAQMSRHHYYLFVPLYYKRNGLPTTPLGAALLHDHGLFVLSILPTSFYVPTIRQLAVELSYPSMVLSVHLRRLTKVLVRLIDLTELVVTFNAEDWYGGPFYQTGNYDGAWKAEFISAFKEMVEMAWRTVKVVRIKKGQFLAMLLNEEGRAESRKLALGSSGAIFPGKAFGRWFLGNLPCKKKDTEEKIDEEVMHMVPSQCPNSTAGSIAQGPTGSRTEVFYLHTPILFSEPFRPWLFSLLSSTGSSSLTYLSILDSKIATRSWSKLLPSLTLPSSLHTLSLNRASVPIFSLAEFLNRHANVHTLRIGGSSALNDNEKDDVVAFKHVKTLIAAPARMSLLIRPGWDYSSLEEVVFQCLVGYEGEFDFTELDIDLDIEDERSEDYNAARKNASQNATPQAAYATETTRGTPEYNNVLRLKSSYIIALRLQLDSPLIGSSWLGTPSSSNNTNSSNMIPPKITAFLSHVTKIYMSWWVSIYEKDIPAIIKWFALFPKLKRVEFMEEVRGVKGVKGVVERKEVVWKIMLEAVRKARPDVEVVEI